MEIPYLQLLNPMFAHFIIDDEGAFWCTEANKEWKRFFNVVDDRYFSLPIQRWAQHERNDLDMMIAFWFTQKHDVGIPASLVYDEHSELWYAVTVGRTMKHQYSIFIQNLKEVCQDLVEALPIFVWTKQHRARRAKPETDTFLNEYPSDPYQRAILKSQERLSLVLKGSNEGWWDWDLVKNEMYYSPRWFEMLGYEPTEFQHHPALWKSLTHPDDLDRVNRLFFNALTGEHDTYEFECRFYHKSGKYIPVMSRGFIVRDALNKPVRVCGTNADMTQHYHMIESLQKANEKAEAANHAKSMFLANMSHEIRTPMNAIIGFSELLEKTSLTEEQASYIHYAKTSAQSLLTIINDILDLSKIESGSMTILQQPFAFHDLVFELIELLKPQAVKKGISLTASIDRLVPASIVGDPIRIRQIILNLLSNAVKFTAEGGVTLRVTVNKRDEIVMFVEDTGIGMSPEVLSKLFQPFSQADDTSTRMYGGTGLGLVISQTLIQLMNGALFVTSEVNKGSTFVCYLPLVTDVEQATIATPPEPERMERLKPMQDTWKILIVEDQAVNRLLLIKLLEKHVENVQLTIATNGQEAVDACENQAFDLVFMDCQMPVMDGFEATRAIRQSDIIYQPYIVALTANAMNGDEVACLNAGMDYYISKPFKVEHLLDLFNQVPRTQQAPSPYLQEYKEAIETLAVETGLSEHDCHELFAESMVILLEMLESFLDEPVITRQHTHQVKGIVANYRLQRLVEITNEMDSEIQAGTLEQVKMRVGQMCDFVRELVKLSKEVRV